MSSKDYEMYNALYVPVPVLSGSTYQVIVTKPFSATPEYQEALANSPTRFNLDYANDIFKSAVSSPLGKRIFTKPKCIIGPDWTHAQFEHDHLTYRFGVKSLKHITPNFPEGVHNLAIKLPNNGFLYKVESSFSPTATGVKFYKHNNYSELGQSTADAPFGDVWGFADWYFGDDDWEPRVLYNFSEERMDIEMKHNSLPFEVTVTWHVGYPIRPFTDHWKPKNKNPYSQ